MDCFGRGICFIWNACGSIFQNFVLNSPQISKSPYSSIRGVPDVMYRYLLPEYYGHEECLVSVP